MENKYLQKQQMVFAVICLFGFTALLRILIGMSFINTLDTFWYKKWAVDLPNGLFSVYSRAKAIRLDYPPMYLFPLYLIGLIYKLVGTEANMYVQMLLLKIFPVLFDMLCGVFLYRKFKEQSFGLAFIAAAAWLLNPSMFFNSACWGQTDSIMAFFLLISFWYLQKDRPVLASVLFAFAGLTKFQSLMFTPVFLLQLYYNNKDRWPNIGKALMSAATTVAAVFLPFMIGSKNPMLFFDVYTGGANTYPYCSLYCFNLYGMLGLDWKTGVKDTAVVFGGITYQTLGHIMLGLVVIMLIYMYAKGRRRNPWVAGLLAMQCIFMLTTRMHERYQIIVLPFALLAYLTTRKKEFGISYVLLSLMTLLNQVFVLMPYVNGNVIAPWETCKQSVIIFMSVLNFILFAYTFIVCTKYLMGSDKSPDASDIKPVAAV